MFGERYGLTGLVLVGSLFACGLDFDREDAIVSIVVAQATAETQTIVVSLQGDDSTLFSASFEFIGPEQRLREIAAISGFLSLRATALDAQGVSIQEVTDTVRLLPGVNEIRIDFVAVQGMPPDGARAEISVGEKVSAWTPSDELTVSIPISRELLENARGQLSTALGASPTRLTLTSIELTSEVVDGQPPSQLDDYWGGVVSLRVLQSDTEVVSFSFTPLDDQVSETIETSVDVTPWLMLPEAQVQVSGPPPRNGPDLPFRLGLRLILVGAPTQ